MRPPPRSVRTGLSDPLTRASQRPNQRRSRSRATCSTQTPGARCPLVREMYLSISVFEHFGGANARRSQVERAPPRRRAARSPGGIRSLIPGGRARSRARAARSPPAPPAAPALTPASGNLSPLSASRDLEAAGATPKPLRARPSGDGDADGRERPSPLPTPLSPAGRRPRPDLDASP